MRPYQNLLNFLHTPAVRWLNKDGDPSGVFAKLKGSAYFSKEAANLLFADATLNLEQIYDILEKDE